jgi:hypothetical protein
MASALERFEALGSLYYTGTGYLRPGKSNPLETGRDSNDDENRERFEAWLAACALTAAIDRIVSLEARVEQLENNEP